MKLKHFYTVDVVVCALSSKEAEDMAEFTFHTDLFDC